MGEHDSLTEDEFDRWHKPHAVLEMMGGPSSSTARGAIGRRILDGGIKAAAGEIRKPGDGMDRQELGLHLWEDWEASEDVDFWLYGETVRYVGNTQVNMYDVRLEPAGVEKLLRQTGRAARPSPTPHNPLGLSDNMLAVAKQMGATAAEVPLVKNAPWMSMHDAGQQQDSRNRQLIDIDALPNRGGKPPLEFWVDMALEVAQAIHNGDLKPSKQADVEDAMDRWLIGKGYNGGPTQMRKYARKVFKLFK